MPVTLLKERLLRWKVFIVELGALDYVKAQAQCTAPGFFVATKTTNCNPFIMLFVLSFLCQRRHLKGRGHGNQPVMMVMVMIVVVMRFREEGSPAFELTVKCPRPWGKGEREPPTWSFLGLFVNLTFTILNDTIPKKYCSYVLSFHFSCFWAVQSSALRWSFF